MHEYPYNVPTPHSVSTKFSARTKSVDNLSRKISTSYFITVPFVGPQAKKF